MPSTFSPNLRLEIQATGENANTWGIKTNTNLDLLEKSLAGHRSISIAGSGTYTLSTANAAEDEARYAFITLTGILTGNRTIIIPSQSKTYYFRNATTGSFTITVKTTPGSGVTLSTGISNVVCNGTDSYLAGTNTEYVDAAVSVLGAATSAQFAATSVQLATVSAQVSINAAQIAAVSVLAQQAIVSAGDKVNKAGDTMTGFLTLHANPTSALHAATKQYVDGGLNRLINGALAVDQRNAGVAQTFTAGAALAYSVDRWYGYSTGANVTGQRVAGAVANTFRYQFTGAASVTAIGFGQRMEALNTADLAGQTCTLSVDLANSLLTTVTWTAFYANTTDTFGTLASPTRTQIATGTFTVTGTVARYSTTISVPAAATTGIEIVFTVGAQTSGTWTIGNVQLEAGSAATPFERRQYEHELALCQRYYERSDNQDTSLFWSGDVTSGTLYYMPVKYAVTKRANPTTSITDISNNGFPNTITVGVESTVGFRADATANATGSGGYFRSNWASAAEL